ncbi:MAG TPA: DUF1963 domain-containing protein [Baekduia sp.]|nr:DUF1963 domain-containing protein [Baekduia sp.]
MVGHTRLGGRPDLPAGSHWPARHGRPLSFLAQVDLGALAQAVPGSTPARGLLSVFADLREGADGIPPVEEFSGPLKPGACVAVRHSRGPRAGGSASCATYVCGHSSHPVRRLLLQLDFDPPLRFAVGDGGALYLTILPADLRAGRFDRLCATFDEG